jgi:hypothetical protein
MTEKEKLEKIYGSEITSGGTDKFPPITFL